MSSDDDGEMPSNNVIPFRFETFDLRIIKCDGSPWWVLADVCRVLDIANPSDVAKRLDDDERDGLDIPDPMGRLQSTTVISEPGLYKIIMTSRKPVAKRFDRWVRHDVLPTIRKTGSYGAAVTQSDMARFGQMLVSGLVTGMKEAIAPLGLRLDHHDQQFANINANMVTKGELNQAKLEMMRWVEQHSKRRQKIKPSEVKKHIRFIEHCGGRCPLCLDTEIIKDGEIIKDAKGDPVAECDHWYTNQDFTADFSILACKAKCHPALTAGKSVKRDQWHSRYQSYQDRRREFEGVPSHLPFGYETRVNA